MGAAIANERQVLVIGPIRLRKVCTRQRAKGENSSLPACLTSESRQFHISMMPVCAILKARGAVLRNMLERRHDLAYSTRVTPSA